jgi:hypothetical protein
VKQPGFVSELTADDRTVLLIGGKGSMKVGANATHAWPNTPRRSRMANQGARLCRRLSTSEMHTQGADFFDETYFLKRGNTDLKDGVATPSFCKY